MPVPSPSLLELGLNDFEGCVERSIVIYLRQANCTPITRALRRPITRWEHVSRCTRLLLNDRIDRYHILERGHIQASAGVVTKGGVFICESITLTKKASFEIGLVEFRF